MTTMSVELRYETPPPRRRSLNAILSLMTLEPEAKWGEWVRIADGYNRTVANSTCQRLRSREGRRVPDGRWEFRYGDTDDDTGWGVWARYLGPDAAAAGGDRDG